MWNEKGNSLSQVYGNRTPRQKFILIIDRNLRKIGHNYGIENPLWELLAKLSESTGKTYTWLDDLDDITLEGLANNTRLHIQDLCEKVKQQSQWIINKQ